MARLQSMADLAHYCLRSLGGGINEVEVTEEQMKDRITEALEFFVDRHFDGTDEVWFAHAITEEESLKGCVKLPYSMKCVVDVSSTISSIFSPYGISIAGIGVISTNMTSSEVAMSGDYGHGNMTGYYISRSYINLMNDLMTPQPYSSYNAASGELRLQGQQLVVGDGLMVHGYRSLDFDESPDVYNDRWLKKYATALIKRQWGSNLKKYTGIQLPGSITINGQEIYDEAMGEIDKLEEEFSERYEYMASMMIA